ncbi:MAG: hypothetical protein IPG91_11630 [Ideonella sp.]|nr:hypothetical protein [Ideonella sp.]
MPRPQAGVGSARQCRRGDAPTTPTTPARGLPGLLAVALLLRTGRATPPPQVDREADAGKADASTWLNLKAWPPSPLWPVELR